MLRFLVLENMQRRIRHKFTKYCASSSRCIKKERKRNIIGIKIVSLHE